MNNGMIRFETPQGAVFLNWDNVLAVVPSSTGELVFVMAGFVMSPQGPVPLEIRAPLTVGGALKDELMAAFTEDPMRERTALIAEALSMMRAWAQKNDLPVEVPPTPPQGNDWMRCQAMIEGLDEMQCEIDFGVCFVCRRCKIHGHTDECVMRAPAAQST